MKFIVRRFRYFSSLHIDRQETKLRIRELSFCWWVDVWNIARRKLCNCPWILFMPQGISKCHQGMPVCFGIYEIFIQRHITTTSFLSVNAGKTALLVHLSLCYVLGNMYYICKFREFLIPERLTRKCQWITWNRCYSINCVILVMCCSII